MQHSQLIVLCIVTIIAGTISYLFTIEKGSIRNEYTREERAQSSKFGVQYNPKGSFLGNGIRPEDSERTLSY